MGTMHEWRRVISGAIAEAIMFTFLRASRPAVHGTLAAAPFDARLAAGVDARVAACVAAGVAACVAACLAWPSPAAAQQHNDASASSASATGPGASGERKDDDGLPAATRQTRADDRRLLGGPRRTFAPYVNGDPSPKSQEDALMSEQRMTIVSPSEFYSSASPSMDGSGGDRADDGSARGSRRRVARALASSQQAAPANPAGGIPSRDTYRTGTLSAPVYRNPYDMQNAAGGQAYRSPW